MTRDTANKPCDCCGGMTRLTGGVYGDARFAHLLPVRECLRCGHSVDLRLEDEQRDMIDAALTEDADTPGDYRQGREL